jgi:hypothetical protein
MINWLLMKPTLPSPQPRQQKMASHLLPTFIRSECLINSLSAMAPRALTLAAGTGYTLGTTGAVAGTIRNDDFTSIE